MSRVWTSLTHSQIGLTGEGQPHRVGAAPSARCHPLLAVLYPALRKLWGQTLGHWRPQHSLMPTLHSCCRSDLGPLRSPPGPTAVPSPQGAELGCTTGSPSGWPFTSRPASQSSPGAQHGLQPSRPHIPRPASRTEGAAGPSSANTSLVLTLGPQREEGRPDAPGAGPSRHSLKTARWVTGYDLSHA